MASSGPGLRTVDEKAGPARVPGAVYAACYAILGVILVYGLVWRWLRPVVLEDPIQVEPHRVAQVEQRLDPNTATWSELSRLPGIGESLAKAIVAYRESRRAERAEGANSVVFRRAEDLDAVRGIGRATIDRIRPNLRFPAETSSSE